MVLLFSVLVLVLVVLFILTFIKFLISDFPFFSFSREEVSSYECGFEQHSLSRIPLSIRYFLLTLVFLIFDLEILLLIITPLDLTFTLSAGVFVLISLCFILLLFFGLIFEWFQGALEWVM